MTRITRGIITLMQRPRTIAAALAASMLLGAGAAADTWRVQGEIEVAHQIDEIRGRLGASGAIKGARVRVRASTIGGAPLTWNEWIDTRLDNHGGFDTGSLSKSGADRRIQVQVKFENDRLEIRRPRTAGGVLWRDAIDVVFLGTAALMDSWNDWFAADWYTVYDETHGPRSVNQIFRFDSGGAHDLGDSLARDHAQLWFILDRVQQTLEDAGHPFLEPVHVAYPDGILGGSTGSYADPIVTHRTVFLRQQDLEEDTPIHEIMHVWAYQHSDGESKLATTLLRQWWASLWDSSAPTPSTHCLVADSTIAFHEGFAHYAASALRELMWSGTPCGSGPCEPYNRAYLNAGFNSIDAFEESGPAAICTDSVSNIATAQRHEGGWVSLFRLGTLPRLSDYDMLERGEWFADEFAEQPGSDCSAISTPDFFDVLAAFQETLTRDYLDSTGITFSSFLDRAGWTEHPDGSLIELIDPASTVQPEPACEPALTIALQAIDVELVGEPLLQVLTGTVFHRVALYFSYEARNFGRGPMDGPGELFATLDGWEIDRVGFEALDGSEHYGQTVEYSETLAEGTHRLEVSVVGDDGVAYSEALEIEISDEVRFEGPLETRAPGGSGGDDDGDKGVFGYDSSPAILDEVHPE